MVTPLGVRHVASADPAGNRYDFGLDGYRDAPTVSYWPRLRVIVPARHTRCGHRCCTAAMLPFDVRYCWRTLVRPDSRDFHPVYRHMMTEMCSSRNGDPSRALADVSRVVITGLFGFTSSYHRTQEFTVQQQPRSLFPVDRPRPVRGREAKCLPPHPVQHHFPREYGPST